jgi:hypothetical protein
MSLCTIEQEIRHLTAAGERLQHQMQVYALEQQMRPRMAAGEQLQHKLQSSSEMERVRVVRTMATEDALRHCKPPSLNTMLDHAASGPRLDVVALLHHMRSAQWLWNWEQVVDWNKLVRAHGHAVMDRLSDIDWCQHELGASARRRRATERSMGWGCKTAGWSFVSAADNWSLWNDNVGRGREFTRRLAWVITAVLRSGQYDPWDAERHLSPAFDFDRFQRMRRALYQLDTVTREALQTAWHLRSGSRARVITDTLLWVTRWPAVLIEVVKGYVDCLQRLSQELSLRRARRHHERRARPRQWAACIRNVLPTEMIRARRPLSLVVQMSALTAAA